MTQLAVAQPPRAGALQTLFELSRFHIIAIACMAALTFGWLLTGQHLWLAAALCGLDWFIVNLTNRVVDLAEDRTNGIVGTDLVARHGRAFEVLCFGLLVGSLVLVPFFQPALLWPRLAFHAIGLAYNYKLIPKPGGFTRFKEIYFFKNFSSAVLFLLSTMVYPVVIGGGPVDWALAAALVGFFLPLEITYEIFYDLRDVKGDTEQRVPTFPVAHGVPASHAIIWALLAASAASLLATYAAGLIPWRAVVLVAGTIQQALLFGLLVKRNPSARNCILVTYLGAGQVLSYNVWIWAGLPLQFW